MDLCTVALLSLFGGGADSLNSTKQFSTFVITVGKNLEIQDDYNIVLWPWTLESNHSHLYTIYLYLFKPGKNYS